jgi:hypothetical protein
MHFSIRPAALAVALTAALVLPALASGAPRSTTVFVSRTGVAGARDVDCATAAYQSVQDAVTAVQRPPDHPALPGRARTNSSGPMTLG